MNSTFSASATSSRLHKVLPKSTFAIPVGTPHFDYAALLLASLGATIGRTANDLGRNSIRDTAALSPALDWASSGAMAISRNFAGEPILRPFALASVARGALFAFARLTKQHQFALIDAPALLGERAAIFEMPKPDRLPTQSCSRSCRLLQTQDAWIALNLARQEDFALLPAWIDVKNFENPWDEIAKKLALLPSQEAIERARELGLAVACAAPPAKSAPPWFHILEETDGPEPKANQPLVLDLASLWAGPLCTHLLQQAGARVIKVESLSRPDGARRGPTKFFDLFNAEKESVALDLRTEIGRAQLAALFEHADIVVESARPRAMTQFGFDIPALVRRRTNLTWISITGYGRQEPEANWIAFGDDAAVAAGLAAFCADLPTADSARNMYCATKKPENSRRIPIFCGDAIADPLTGMHAAVAAQASWQAGGSRLFDISLCNVAAHALGFAQNIETRATLECEIRKDHSAQFEKIWRVCDEGISIEVAAPRARQVIKQARSLGTDTERILRELRIPC